MNKIPRWYKKALESDNDEIKALLADITDPNDVSVSDKAERIKVILKQSERADEFPYTPEIVMTLTSDLELNDVIKLCDKKIAEIEAGRKRKENPIERSAVIEQQWLYQKMIGLARHQLRINRKKQREKENQNRITQKATKQAQFCMLVRKGISFSNITTHDEGVSISEIGEIVDENVINTCSEYDPEFRARWERWKAKFLS